MHGLVVQAAEGLVAQPDQLAPTVLSVPGEAMLLDPPASRRPLVLPEIPEPSGDLSPDETGIASWYGAKFHRRRTASGELFDRGGFTAAHRTLPFGSRVCVRSQVNGRGVVVRINDRGPHTPNRVIDISEAAAKSIGLIGLGLKPVEIFALEDGQTDCPEP
ncbi:MAG: septal ring lytic transglycosylase RlpA family protein [Burkholderiaceae bacterium]|nr:septal ring lytic transglycosylase RlpA family protein [Burkholderiaceae bacterium]